MTNDSVATLRLLAKCGSMDLSMLGPIADEMERLTKLVQKMNGYLGWKLDDPRFAPEPAVSKDEPEQCIYYPDCEICGPDAKPSGEPLPAPTDVCQSGYTEQQCIDEKCPCAKGQQSKS